MKTLARLIGLFLFVLVAACSKEPTYVHPDMAPGEAAQKASPKPSTVPMNP